MTPDDGREITRLDCSCDVYVIINAGRDQACIGGGRGTEGSNVSCSQGQAQSEEEEEEKEGRYCTLGTWAFEGASGLVFPLFSY